MRDFEARSQRAAEHQGIVPIAEMLVRNHGTGTTIENTGGFTMAGVIHLISGRVFAFNADSVSVFGSVEDWEEGEEEIAQQDLDFSITEDATATALAIAEFMDEHSTEFVCTICGAETAAEDEMDKHLSHHDEATGEWMD